MPQSSQQCQGRWWTLVTAAGSAGRGGEGRRRGKRAGPQREAKEGKLNLCVQRTRVTGGIRAMALSLGGGGTLGQAPGRRWGNSGSQWQRALRFSGATAPTRSSPDGHPNFQRCGPAQEQEGAHSLRAARARLRNALLRASPEGALLAPVSALTWASLAGRGAGGDGRGGRRRAPSPHGLTPGPPGWLARTRSPPSAQRARALFPPGWRGRSRAAGWRGRTPGSAGCGTRRGSAAPASGPRPWVAPWDAETPCCAAGRTGPGLGSGCPRRERGSRAGGNSRPGSEMTEMGERPRGRGEGVVPGRGADPATRERGTSGGATRRSAANGGRARRRAQQDL